MAFNRTAASGASSDFTVAWAVGESVDASRVDPKECFAGQSVGEVEGGVKPAPAISSSAVPDVAQGGAGGTALARSARAPGSICVPGTPSPAGGAAPGLVGGPAPGSAGAAAVISAGHVDYATRVVDGRLRSFLKDGTTPVPVWREPGSVVLNVGAGAATRVPEGPFSFLGAPGSTVYQLPQTQAAGLPWLGWNTPSPGADVAGPVTWSLDNVSGPGAVTVYELGAFGEPIQLLAPGRSIPVPAGVHAHASWAFSAAGAYRITMTQSALLANGSRSADTQVLTIMVGNAGNGAAPAAGTATSLLAGPAAGPGVGSAASNVRCLPALLSLPVPAVEASLANAAVTTGTRAGDGAAPAAGLAPSSGEVPLWLWVAMAAGLTLLGAGTGGGTVWLLRRRSSIPLIHCSISAVL